MGPPRGDVAAGSRTFRDRFVGPKRTSGLRSVLVRTHHVSELLHVDPAGGQSLAVAEHHLGPADRARRQRGDRASLHQPAAVNPNEQAGLDPMCELADRAAHQMDSGGRV